MRLPWVIQEAEIGVMQPQAKECLEPPEAVEGEEGFSTRAFRGIVVLPPTSISDFWPQEL